MVNAEAPAEAAKKELYNIIIDKAQAQAQAAQGVRNIGVHVYAV